MSTPNWGQLVAQGRAKAIGVPWSEEEAAARSLGIPAEYVRSGILTIEAYEEAKAQDDKDGAPLERLPRSELEKRARELGIEFTGAATDAVLVQLISAQQPRGVAKAVSAVKKAVTKKGKTK